MYKLMITFPCAFAKSNASCVPLLITILTMSRTTRAYIYFYSAEISFSKMQNEQWPNNRVATDCNYEKLKSK